MNSDFGSVENVAAPSSFVFDLGRRLALRFLPESSSGCATDPLLGGFLAGRAEPSLLQRSTSHLVRLFDNADRRRPCRFGRHSLQRSSLFLRTRTRKMKAIPKWLHPLIGGLIT